MSDLIGSYYAASLFCFWIVVAVALFDQITMNDGMIILGRFRRLSLVRVHWEGHKPKKHTGTSFNSVGSRVVADSSLCHLLALPRSPILPSRRLSNLCLL